MHLPSAAGAASPAWAAAMLTAAATPRSARSLVRVSHGLAAVDRVLALRAPTRMPCRNKFTKRDRLRVIRGDATWFAQGSLPLVSAPLPTAGATMSSTDPALPASEAAPRKETDPAAAAPARTLTPSAPATPSSSPRPVSASLSSTMVDATDAASAETSTGRVYWYTDPYLLDRACTKLAHERRYDEVVALLARHRMSGTPAVWAHVLRHLEQAGQTQVAWDLYRTMRERRVGLTPQAVTTVIRVLEHAVSAARSNRRTAVFPADVAPADIAPADAAPASVVLARATPATTRADAPADAPTANAWAHTRAADPSSEVDVMTLRHPTVRTLSDAPVPHLISQAIRVWRHAVHQEARSRQQARAAARRANAPLFAEGPNHELVIEADADADADADAAEPGSWGLAADSAPPNVFHINALLSLLCRAGPAYAPWVDHLWDHADTTGVVDKVTVTYMYAYLAALPDAAAAWQRARMIWARLVRDDATTAAAATVAAAATAAPAPSKGQAAARPRGPTEPGGRGRPSRQSSPSPASTNVPAVPWTVTPDSFHVMSHLRVALGTRDRAAYALAWHDVGPVLTTSLTLFSADLPTPAPSPPETAASLRRSIRVTAPVLSLALRMAASVATPAAPSGTPPVQSRRDRLGAAAPAAPRAAAPDAATAAIMADATRFLDRQTKRVSAGIGPGGAIDARVIREWVWLLHDYAPQQFESTAFLWDRFFRRDREAQASPSTLLEPLLLWCHLAARTAASRPPPFSGHLRGSRDSPAGARSPAPAAAAVAGTLPEDAVTAGAASPSAQVAAWVQRAQRLWMATEHAWDRDRAPWRALMHTLHTMRLHAQLNSHAAVDHVAWLTAHPFLRVLLALADQEATPLSSNQVKQALEPQAKCLELYRELQAQATRAAHLPPRCVPSRCASGAADASSNIGTPTALASTTRL
ncbi:hypothetical protein CXG81DRAFT_17306 [Caulochytrium protostelioides]|uniref:Pentatricopeptide repeat domain-containing protein n=1 Tax=Caulochytrium protostelioides TaxID=1555241 RepID=A0A4P9XCI1_9FUNG|nr:hypothetical protein CXG81DRAFT_17306 [Caulochytrium protostelioides]|eukprot:RKP03146.1 hypothetical protein CXG81DRAFT_17306 [Caulochytrium protostelioides]